MGEREISHCRDLHPTSHVQLMRLHDKVVLRRWAGYCAAVPDGVVSIFHPSLSRRSMSALPFARMPQTTLCVTHASRVGGPVAVGSGHGVAWPALPIALDRSPAAAALMTPTPGTDAISSMFLTPSGVSIRKTLSRSPFGLSGQRSARRWYSGAL